MRKTEKVGRHMQIAVDFHTHTIASGHYTTDTLTDLAKAANSAGLAYLAVTDPASWPHKRRGGRLL